MDTPHSESVKASGSAAGALLEDPDEDPSVCEVKACLVLQVNFVYLLLLICIKLLVIHNMSDQFPFCTYVHISQT